MKLREKLVPVSFHLRNFNNYTKLDLDASENGNLTFIGENTSGKTTLANCFFPMLIDGSIATPSFNPAKDTDKLDKTSKARNSSRDSRTFETMLLGWGTGAMKVRTGYSYMVMKSKTRQAIVGIGAHRAVGANGGATWWFVLLNDDPYIDMKLRTVDDTGRSLEKREFSKQKEEFEDKLQIFNNVTDFQSFVSEKIYGFGNKDLNHLAATYRLLASPILTAGSGKLTPILEAMKNAQEKMDSSLIDSVAETQKEINRKNLTNQRIEQAQKRLHKLKKEVFWRNLNQIQRLIVSPYSKNLQELEKDKTSKEKYQKDSVNCAKQLKRLSPMMEEAEKLVIDLKEKQIKQNNIKEQRQDKQAQINLLQKEINRYKDLKSRLDDQKRQLDELEQKRIRLKGRFQSADNQTKSFFADLQNDIEVLSELSKILENENYLDANVALKKYLTDMRKVTIKYRTIKQRQESLSEGIQIVTETRKNMDVKIELRTKGPMVSRIREGLLQDNLDVHNIGAAKMSSSYSELERQSQDLLKNNEDLAELIKQKDFLNVLQNYLEQYQQLVDQYGLVKNEFQEQNSKVQAKRLAIETLEQDLNNNFQNYDVAMKELLMSDYRKQLDALIIDPELDDKLVIAEKNQSQYRKNQQTLENKRVSSKAKSDSLNGPILNLTNELTEIASDCVNKLSILSPYMDKDVELSDIDDLLTFAHQHGSDIRNNNFGDLSERIGRLVHNNGATNIDKYALDNIFEDRGHGDFASIMRQQKSKDQNDIRILSFDINQAIYLMEQDGKAMKKSLEQLEKGNVSTQRMFLSAATNRIQDQYRMVERYNEMLSHGSKNEDEIRLKISLQPTTVSQEVIDESLNTQLDNQLDGRPKLLEEVENRLNRLANDTNILEDEFANEARRLLDIRQWSEFKIWIHRKHSKVDHFEEVDDKFVQSGGSGAEKAQAMVLPLLLVPKMILKKASSDAPALVMFDEFADKLDPETAKSFAKTIDHFGFNFLATMPGGAQNKILADGVENIAYEIIPPKNRDDGKFHRNSVIPVMTWYGETDE